MSRRAPFFTEMALQATPFGAVHYMDPVTFDWVCVELEQGWW
jgi:hypothetical protein